MSASQRDLFVFGLAIGLGFGLIIGAGMKALERRHQAHAVPAELVQPGAAELNPE